MVNLSIQSFIVRAESLQDFPNDLIAFVVAKSGGGILILRYDDWQYDVTDILVGSPSHHAADCLDDIHLGAFRLHEEHRV